MSRHHWRWPRRIAAGLAFTVALLLAIQLTLNRILSLDELIEGWSPVFGVPLEVESALVHLLPHPLVRMRGLRFRQGVSLERADIELELLPLLRGDFEAGLAELRGGHITLVREADGGLHLGGLEAGASGSAEAPVESTPAATALPSLPRIVARDLTIRYEDHTPESGPVTSEVILDRVEIVSHRGLDALDASATGRLGGESAAPTLELTARLDATSEDGRRPVRLEIRTHGIDPTPIPRHLPAKWGIRAAGGSLDASIDLAWSDAGFEGRLDLDFAPGTADYAGVELEGRIRFQANLADPGEFALTGGHVVADQARLQQVSATTLEGRLTYTRRRVDIESFSFQGWDGAVSGSGTLEIREPLEFDLVLKGEELLANRLLGRPEAPPGKDPVRMAGEATVRGHWVGGDDWLKPLSGTATVSMHGGEVASGDLMKSLLVSLPGKFADRHDPNLKGNFHQTPLEELSGSFALEAGRGETEDLRVRTADYTLGLGGWIDGGGLYEMKGDVRFTPGGIQRLLTAASVRASYDEKAGLPAVPYEISGNLSEGTFRVHLEKQPLTALVILPWAADELLEPFGGGDD